ncbi:MAG TPA: cation diffusion facilitator family transporter [Gaiellaceae bacterium]|nr:cation diffusion facilitator family transporter [Gaiellaceae bacterium]
MHPQRRTALVSVLAAATLVVLKLATGVASGSLGLVSEALHSGTDLVAALLTFFAIGVAVRPADPGHQYGHGKAEHLAALGEGAFLVAASVTIAAVAVARLSGVVEAEVDAAWWTFVVVVLVMAIDAARTTVSLRTARRFHSAALQSNALHFGGDLAGTTAVLVGLVAAASGYPEGDSLAALFVAVLVLAAALRLMRRNVDVLMDRAPAGAHEAAVAAIEALSPSVELRRLRLRHAAGRHFADVVIGISPGAAVGQGHAAADAVEDAVQRALPESDVVVHVEPAAAEEAIRDRAHAAALGVAGVREVHNVSVLHVGGRTAVSLHLKLPAELPLEDAHRTATEVERAIAAAVPGVDAVQTHLEPLAEAGEGRVALDDQPEREAVARIVRETTGTPPRSLRFLHTHEGLVAHLTLAVEPTATLSEAHARASEVEHAIRTACPRIADAIVHTEP